MLEALAEVFVQAAEPRSAHAPVHAVKSARLSWVNKLAAGLGHGRSLGLRALCENQIGRNLGSDLSDGWVSRLLCHPSYVAGQAVRCIVCYGAQGPAQELGEILGAPWRAATGRVQVLPNGQIDVLDGGVWINGAPK